MEDINELKEEIISYLSYMKIINLDNINGMVL
jgi:hypothetical protein